MTHFDRSIKKKIRISADCTFSEFCAKVNLAFTDEIAGNEIRLYTFPVGFTDIDQRTTLDAGNFESVLKSLLGLNPGSSKAPVLYVWNYNNGSPTKMPDAKAEMEEPSSISNSSKASTVSRNSQSSKSCRRRDKHICLCCGYFNEITNVACHISEIKSYKGISEIEKIEKLDSLNLANPNDMTNMITLCRLCHGNFDKHFLGIHPTESRWIVSKFLRGDRDITQQGCTFLSIHSKKIDYATDWYAPPPAVLHDRWSYFLSCNCKSLCTDDNRGANCAVNYHYCELCPQVFHGESGRAERDAHQSWHVSHQHST